MEDSLRLEDLAWLRRLARRLVKDAALADDAIQETLLAARSSKSPSRSWLSRVLRNKLKQEFRGRSRRAMREERRAGLAERNAPATDDLLATLELHGLLLEEVRGLKEPYRSTILLRFMREWSPRQIARHQSVPVKTVHTRIERGLGELRARLDRAAPREEWLTGFALLLGHPPTPQPFAAGAGAFAMSSSLTLKITLATAIVALLTVPLVLREGRQKAPRDEEQIVRGAGDASSASAEVPALDGHTERSHARPTDSKATTTIQQSTPTAQNDVLSGLVCDVNGAPVPDLEIVFEARQGSAFAFDEPLREPRATSDASGRFTMPMPPTRGRLNVASSVWVALHRPNLGPAAPELAPMLVVSNARSYGGRVQDADGHGIANASIHITRLDAFLEPIVIADRVLPLRLPLGATMTDEHGAFAIDAVGYVSGTVIEARRDDYETLRQPLPVHSKLDLSMTLTERSAPERSVSGRVISHLGVPVEGARVSAGDRSVATGDEGRFSLEVEAWRNDAMLRAFAPSEGVCIERLDAQALERLLAGESLELQLSGPALSLVGRVVDANGDAVPGATVWTPDTTFFGSAPVVGERSMIAMATTEALSSGAAGPYSWTQSTTADAGGRFELRGLSSRAYDVFAADARTLSASSALRLVPGHEPVELVLPGQPMTRVSGVVTTTSGVPIAGVRVRAGRKIEWERPRRDTNFWHGSPLLAPGATCDTADHVALTDSSGRFAFEALVVDGAWLSIHGENVFGPVRVALASIDDLSNIEIEVRQIADFRVTCRNDADAFSLRTRDDEFHPVYVPVEEALLSVPKVDIVGGRALPARTGSGSVTIVLWRADEELERHDIVLTGGRQRVEL